MSATSGTPTCVVCPSIRWPGRLWGVPVALNPGCLGAKTGLVIAQDAVTVEYDGAVKVKWSDAVSDDFAKQQGSLPCRGRFGVSVNQPGRSEGRDSRLRAVGPL